MECSSEAPENATVTVQCDDVVIFNITYLVNYTNELINITDNLLVPRHQQCTLFIIFSNNAGHSDQLIRTLSKR